MAIKLFVDATADLQADFLAEHPEIEVVDTPILATSRDDVVSFSHLSPDDFQRVDEEYFRKGYRVTTSQPLMMSENPEESGYVSTAVRRAVSEGWQVLYLTMGSGMSGTFALAEVCFEKLREELGKTERELLALDSQCMSTGTACLVTELFEHFDLSSMTDVTPLADYVKANRGHIVHLFTWSELDYIVKSGRVSTVKAFAAKLIRFIPIGSAVYLPTGERKLELVNGIHSVRSISAFARVLAAYIEAHLAGPDLPVTVAYANNPETGEQLAQKLKELLPGVHIISGLRLSSAIQAHGGPTSLHINFHAKDEPALEDTTREITRLISEARKKR